MTPDDPNEPTFEDFFPTTEEDPDPDYAAYFPEPIPDTED